MTALGSAEEIVGEEAERIAVVMHRIGQRDRRLRGSYVERVLVRADHSDLNRAHPGCQLLVIRIGLKRQRVADPVDRLTRRPNRDAEGISEALCLPPAQPAGEHDLLGRRVGC